VFAATGPVVTAIAVCDAIAPTSSSAARGRGKRLTRRATGTRQCIRGGSVAAVIIFAPVVAARNASGGRDREV